MAQVRPLDDRLITERDTCDQDDILESVKAFLLGDLTLAQLEGVTADQLYSMADIGYDYLMEGRTEVARRIFEGLNGYNPMDPYFHSVLGSIYQRTGDHDRAILHYESAVQLYPHEIIWWTNLGETLLVKGNLLRHAGKSDEASALLARAREALQKAMRLDPAGRNPSALRARVLRAMA